MIRVVKIGGRAQQATGLIPALASAWREAPGGLVVVHGGGDEVSALQRALGREPQFVAGRRVTTDDDIAVLRMTLSGVVNKRLVAALVAQGVPAVGVSGEDAALLSAIPADAETMGRVGEPAGTNVHLVRHLLKGGFVPVISPLARDAQSDVGDALNVNGDDAAAAIAASLEAAELLLIADVPGVVDQGTVVGTIEADRVASLVRTGMVTGGMIAKLEASTRALLAGVSRVRIGDLTAITDANRGTRIVAPAAPQVLTPVFA